MPRRRGTNRGMLTRTSSSPAAAELGGRHRAPESCAENKRSEKDAFASILSQDPRASLI